MKRPVSIKSSLVLATALLATALHAPGPALAQAVNWNGAYLGGQIGGANFKATTPAASTDNANLIDGATAGYDYDMGTWVVGVGADIDFPDNNLPGSPAALDRIYRLKLRGGYKIGNGLIYGTGGFANAHLDNVGSDDGYLIGGGYEHLIMTNFTVGGEVLYHDFNNFNNTGTDVEVISYQVRGTFRF